jgi:hypothetical protein
MDEKKIDNLIPLIEFLMELGNVIELVSKTKNFTHFFKLMDEVLAFQSVEWSNVIPELRDISQDEKNELIRIASKKFDLENDNIEFIIEEAINIIINSAYLIKRCVELRKSKSDE